ncbi:alpha/beta hydrolase [Spirosoma endbachense]|uniref:Alpha/beta fold hydrolase n=1 Tax=Spirosoma endbachense TaxID=2666025 RepID=A0A6P1VRD5_9BACT|nr:alpha/beta fold hydrolase [Spirosoma endbachense]QHV94968.1 alpha/beta fold hydrolase [Spirosoma endbachense]
MHFRFVILGLTLSVLVGSISSTVRAQSTARKPTMVIVHGAWGGSWAFKKVDSILTNRGYTVYRPSLTGQGERVNLASPDIGLTTHINDVVNTILYEDLHDIILVGHSYGGMVITGVADRVADRIRSLVYLDAILPNDGESVMSIQGDRADFIKPMLKDGFIVPMWVKADQKPPKDVPQSLKTFTETISLKNPAARNLPARYILTVEAGKDPKADDFAIHADRAKQRGWPVSQLISDHNPQWSAILPLVNALDQ